MTQNRLTSYDRATAHHSLIDTGADVPVLQGCAIPTSIIRSTHLSLYAANGAIINASEEQALTLDIGLRRPIHWRSIVADLSRPIISADLLRHYGVAVDLKGKRLLDQLTSLSVSTGFNCSKVSTISTVTKIGHVYSVLFRMSLDITALARPHAVSQKDVSPS